MKVKLQKEADGKKQSYEERLKRLSIKDHIHDDAWMVAEGLRQPKQQSRDSSVWTRTTKEREILRGCPKIRMSGCSSSGRKHIPVYTGLIVYVQGLTKTTYSVKCWQADIPRIIGNFNTEGKVIKYQWNGRTYQPNEVPFWS